MKIAVIVGHPAKESLCHSLASAYVDGAKATGAEVQMISVGELKFDPILHEGYSRIQDLEPDLKKVQDLIVWAEHLVFVYPVWWGSIPALFKGACWTARYCLALGSSTTRKAPCGTNI